MVEQAIVVTSLSHSEQSPISSSSILDRSLRNPKSELGTFFKVVNDCGNKKKNRITMNSVSKDAHCCQPYPTSTHCRPADELLYSRNLSAWQFVDIVRRNLIPSK